MRSDPRVVALRRAAPGIATAIALAALCAAVALGAGFYDRPGATVLYLVPAVVLAGAYGVRAGAAGALLATGALAYDTRGFDRAGALADSASLLALLVLGAAAGAYAHRLRSRARARAGRDPGVADLVAPAETAGMVDAVTGLGDRRRLEVDLPRLVATAERSMSSLAVLVVTLGELMPYRDANGSLTCDRMLKALGAAWQDQMRSSDLLVRAGDCEFVAALLSCSEANAWRVAERLAESVPAPAPAAVGVACWDGGERGEQLLARAAVATRAARAAGAVVHVAD
jgi:diguanylate cyclase (GGDEF)-like protein